MKKSEIKGQACAKRALEVAAVGNHTIMLWGPHGSGKSTLVSAFPEVQHVVVRDTCACGNFQHPGKECNCQERNLYRWNRRVLRDAESCDMLIEVPPVPAKEFESRLDPTADDWFERRLATARDFGKTHTSLETDDSGARTIEMVTRRLCLSVGEYEKMKRVSRSIANLDGSEILKAKHIAEAVQYRTALRPLQD